MRNRIRKDLQVRHRLEEKYRRWELLTCCDFSLHGKQETPVCHFPFKWISPLSLVRISENSSWGVSEQFGRESGGRVPHHGGLGKLSVSVPTVLHVCCEEKWGEGGKEQEQSVGGVSGYPCVHLLLLSWWSMPPIRMQWRWSRKDGPVRKEIIGNNIHVRLPQYCFGLILPSNC